jgi:P-type Ca2+ transporter type 2C
MKQDKTTPLKRKLKKLSKILVAIAVILCIIILGLQFFWAWKTQVKDCHDAQKRNATATPLPTTTPPSGNTSTNATVEQCKLTKHDIIDVIKVGISLAVSVIPEGLVAVVTITMALGVQRMRKENVLVRNLPVIEGLGSITSVRKEKGREKEREGARGSERKNKRTRKRTIDKDWLRERKRNLAVSHFFSSFLLVL